MPSPDEILEHLMACTDALYLVLGESAATLTNDAYAIRAFEASRSFGELVLAMRNELEEPDDGPLPIVRDVLGRALASDDTGALVLYAVVMVVGPRLLVSLRDARQLITARDGSGALIDRARDVIVREIRRTADVLRDDSSGEDDDWQVAARELVTDLESSGNAESFGISH